MSLDDNDPFRAEVVARVEAYLSETLEVPRPEFGNMPACPFVRAERLRGQIRFELCKIGTIDGNSIWTIVQKFLIDTKHSSLLIVDPYSRVGRDEGVRLGIDLCDRLRPEGFFAACIHPMDVFAVGGYRTRSPVPYVAILVQARELLDHGRLALKRTDYYNAWSESNREYVNQQIGE